MFYKIPPACKQNPTDNLKSSALILNLLRLSFGVSQKNDYFCIQKCK